MLTIKMIDQFFDRPSVINAIDRAKRRQLSKAGAFVRTTARRSIKPAGKRATNKRNKGNLRGRKDPTISQPGQPPRLHTKSARNLRLILFAWEPLRKSVVIGPLLFKSTDGVRIPEVLEHGGKSYVTTRGRKKPIRIRKRPFMAPALAKEAPKFPNLFANSVRP